MIIIPKFINLSLREYQKLYVFAFIFGFGGSVWGGLTYYIGQPIAYLSFLNASPVVFSFLFLQ